MRVLLAEDSLVNQKLVTALLRRQGHHVEVANNGKEAVVAFHAQPFDLILMDIQMPEVDGLEATAAIRVAEKQTGTHVPIIAMTAHAMQGDRERCLAGRDGRVPGQADPDEAIDGDDRERGRRGGRAGGGYAG